MAQEQMLRLEHPRFDYRFTRHSTFGRRYQCGTLRERAPVCGLCVGLVCAPCKSSRELIPVEVRICQPQFPCGKNRRFEVQSTAGARHVCSAGHIFWHRGQLKVMMSSQRSTCARAPNDAAKVLCVGSPSGHASAILCVVEDWGALLCESLGFHCKQ